MRALIGVELLRRLLAGPVDVRDTKLPGFVLRERASGKHTYYACWTPKATARALGVPPRRTSARWYGPRHDRRGERPEARAAARMTVSTGSRVCRQYQDLSGVAIG